MERRLFASPRLRAVICNSQMVQRRHPRALRRARRAAARHLQRRRHARVHARPSRAPRARSARAIGIAARAIVYLQVGSGFERKGVAAAIDALARVAGAGAPDRRRQGQAHRASMRIARAGSGCRGRVTLAGPQADPRPYYGAADAFVLPTLYDRCPNAALEAMACGLPIVTSTRSRRGRAGARARCRPRLRRRAMSISSRRTCTRCRTAHAHANGTNARTRCCR